MSQLEEFCKRLRTLAVIQEKAHRPAVVRRLRECADMLEHVYDVAEDEWPEIRDTLDMFAAKAINQKQEPRK